MAIKKKKLCLEKVLFQFFVFVFVLGFFFYTRICSFTRVQDANTLVPAVLSAALSKPDVRMADSWQSLAL